MGNHPQGYATPDINLLGINSIRQFWEDTDGIRRYQRHGILRLIAQLYAGEQTINAIHLAKRWLLARASSILIYQELLQRLAPRRLIDSSPQYILSSETLARIQLLFPDAFFIHLVRHPLTQGHALLTTAQGLYLTWDEPWQADEPGFDVQWLWLKQQHTISQFLETTATEQTMRIRLEDLLATPAQVLQRIGQRLGWDDTTACLQPERSPFAHWGPANANLGYSADFLAQPRFNWTQIRPALTTLDPTQALPWRADDQGFAPEVLELARHLGYRLAKPGETTMPLTPPMTAEIADTQMTQLLSDQTQLPPQHSSTPQEVATYRQELEYRIAMLKAFYEEAEQELANLPPAPTTTEPTAAPETPNVLTP